MTAAELQTLVDDFAEARAALQRYEEAALALLKVTSLGPARGLLYAAKESIHATRLVCMEAADAVRVVVAGRQQEGAKAG